MYDMSCGKEGCRASVNAQDSLLVSDLKSYYSVKYGSSCNILYNLLKGKRINLNNIPLSVFSSPLSPFEACIKYLKDSGMSISDIARITSRKPNTISTTYLHASNKYPQIFCRDDEAALKKHSLPVYVVAYRKLSPFEAIVMYQRHILDMKIPEIARLMNRDCRVIWQIYSRALKKEPASYFISEISSIGTDNVVVAENRDIRSFSQLRSYIKNKYSFCESDFSELFRATAIGNIPQVFNAKFNLLSHLDIDPNSLSVYLEDKSIFGTNSSSLIQTAVLRCGKKKTGSYFSQNPDSLHQIKIDSQRKIKTRICRTKQAEIG